MATFFSPTRRVFLLLFSAPIRRATTASSCSLNLDGRVAVVTGGTTGIGLSIAQRLAENGAKVVVSSRNQKNVDEAAEKMRKLGLEVVGIAGHFGKEEDRERLISKTLSLYGDINVWVQNAGVNPHYKDIMSTPVSAIDKTYEIHIKSNFRLIQQIYPHMKNSDKPCSIILTSSIAAYIQDFMPSIYAVTKMGINAMTRGFAKELAKENIRINCISIGAIDTKFLEAPSQNGPLFESFQQQCFLKRFGRPEEVAGIAAYLASDDSSYVTGENITVSGGLMGRI